MACSRRPKNLALRRGSSAHPIALAKFYKAVFELVLPFDMGWIVFLSKDSPQMIELHTASQGGPGTELPVISIGVEDLDATEGAVRAALTNR